MLRWLVLIVAGAIVLGAFGGTTLLADARSLPTRAVDALRGEDGSVESRAQISPREFVGIRYGATTDQVRASLGAPEETWTASLERVRLECWLYGIAGARGAFQLCFADGRLSSRFRYG